MEGKENRFKYWQKECKEANAFSCSTQEMRRNVAQLRVFNRTKHSELSNLGNTCETGVFVNQLFL